MDPDELTMHETVHVFYRQKLADAEWELAQALGREAAKDKIIAELRALVEGLRDDLAAASEAVEALSSASGEPVI